jgi:diguanylate cyclase (GGDEF)-like protein
MHDAIRGLSIDIPDKKLTPTISIGIGVWRPAKGHKTFTEYLKESDKALYQAKKAGRNCTVFYDPNEPSNPTASSITESFSPL